MKPNKVALIVVAAFLSVSAHAADDLSKPHAVVGDKYYQFGNYSGDVTTMPSPDGSDDGQVDYSDSKVHWGGGDEVASVRCRIESVSIVNNGRTLHMNYTYPADPLIPNDQPDHQTVDFKFADAAEAKKLHDRLMAPGEMTVYNPRETRFAKLYASCSATDDASKCELSSETRFEKSVSVAAQEEWQSLSSTIRSSSLWNHVPSAMRPAQSYDGDKSYSPVGGGSSSAQAAGGASPNR